MEHKRTDGFILPDGELIPIEHEERVYEQARTWLQSPQEVLEMMWALALEFATKSKFAAARAYFEVLLEENEAEPVNAY
jgi:hypothetical protein